MKSEVKTVPEEKEQKEATAAQTEEDLDPNAVFAFSQVIAAGGNVLKTCDEIDKDQASQAKAEADAKQQRLWQFALDLQKPKVVKSKDEIEKEAKAKRELEALEQNDATSALAGLQVDMEIEKLAESQPTSGEDKETLHK